jgi:cobalt-precorrin 5A hydrolase
MSVAILVINEYGQVLSELLTKGLDGVTIRKGEDESLSELVKRIFDKYEGLVFIAALGIVVRVISPFIKSKHTDPAVVCVDTGGRFAISVVSGHEGRANELAFKVAAVLGAMPVITTGTEARKSLILGIGCRKGIAQDKIKKAILKILEEEGIGLEEIRVVATVDIKRDEPGLRQACAELNLPLVFIPKETIKYFTRGISLSNIVEKKIGLKGVCEPCALLAGWKTRLIIKKQIHEGVTVSLAREG